MRDEIDWHDLDQEELDQVGAPPRQGAGSRFLVGERPPDFAPGPSRRRPLVGALVALALAGAVVYYVVDPGGSATATPRPTATLTATASPTPSFRAQVSPAAEVLRLAQQPGRLMDVVRPVAQFGACPTLPMGAKPLAKITQAIKAALPGYAVLDSSRIIDANTGLCAMQVRAHNGLGSTAVLSITAPTRRSTKPQQPRFATGFQADGSSSTLYVTATTALGWSIQIGAAGPQTQLPDSRDLTTLAGDPRITW